MQKVQTANTLGLGDDEEHMSQWYGGRCVLITGVTSFIGKALLAKLLRSCSLFKNIFLIIREKNHICAVDRLRALLNEPIFEKIRLEKKNVFDKVIPIQYDLTQSPQALLSNTKETFINNVSVVFHCSGASNLSDLNDAWNIDVIGTKNLIKLCSNMPKLKAFIYLSSIYSHADRKIITEKIYAPGCLAGKKIKSLSDIELDTLKQLKPCFPKHGFHAFTQMLTEYLLMNDISLTPVSVVRTGFVTAACQEPEPGWVTQNENVTKIIICQASGLMRSYLGQSTAIAEIVPVDIVVNCLIAVAWHRSLGRCKVPDVYNCTTGNINPITWGEIDSWVPQYSRWIPFDNAFWYPERSICSSVFLNNLFISLTQMFPAYLIDSLLRIVGYRPFMVQNQCRMRNEIEALEPFTTRRWIIENENFKMLSLRPNCNDFKIFNLNAKTIIWSNYIQNYLLGIRRFILKQKDEDLEHARKRLAQLYLVHKATYLTTLSLVFYTAYKTYHFVTSK